SARAPVAGLRSRQGGRRCRLDGRAVRRRTTRPESRRPRYHHAAASARGVRATRVAGPHVVGTDPALHRAGPRRPLLVRSPHIPATDSASAVRNPAPATVQPDPRATHLESRHPGTHGPRTPAGSLHGVIVVSVLVGFVAAVLLLPTVSAVVSLARQAGAQCLERHDRQLPGKPRAIAWALSQQPLEDVDSVVIIDADTVVDPDFGVSLAQAAPVTHKAFQGYFDVRNPTDGALTRMAAVLAAGNYRFAYALKRRVGLNAPLLGNGMCIGTAVLATHGWNAFTIAEDWELYTLYTTQGVPIESLERARLYAEEARSLRQSSSQRQRWTAGKLTVLGRLITRLIGSAKIGPAQKFDALAELTAPGPVVHLGLVTALALLVAVARPPEAAILLFALGASLVRFAIYTVAGLLVQPHPLRCAVA